MSNRLQYEKSPYLLQHAQNPVDWYGWGEEAFEKAKTEDKPVFLSIGYSTCHWCHVMAHESFENDEIAETLNRYFVSVKVDREERSDVDNVYMKACVAMTGGGGWPTSLFLTPDKKPFYAGTYFPPKSRHGMTGFLDLLNIIADKWEHDKKSLLDSASEIVEYLKPEQQSGGGDIDETLPEKAFNQFTRTFDSKNGGFGNAPKFPTPHNLLFLLLYGKLTGSETATGMASHTLMQMRKGGIFDHIGGGFSRYSTDTEYPVPHFEKMLYDNALLIIAYISAYSATKNVVFLDTARKTAEYLFREMQSPDGVFYSAEDADSEGREGKFYVFGYNEVISILGESEGADFNRYYGITQDGNFEGSNILNRLHDKIELTEKFDGSLKKLYEYRKARYKLHLDDKVITTWNALMIVALCGLYRVTGEQSYLERAIRIDSFIVAKLSENNLLYVSCRDGKRSEMGFLDEYAFYSAALISLYGITEDKDFLVRAQIFCRSADDQFWDGENGGYLFSGRENEKMIVAHKEIYDNAMPSGNSVMAFSLVRLYQLTGNGSWRDMADKQLSFLSSQANYPTGQTLFLTSLLLDKNPPPQITVVCSGNETAGDIILKLPVYSDYSILDKPTGEYKLVNGNTSYYVCKGNVCLPPSDDLSKVL